MSTSSSKAASLPDVATFDPLNEASSASSSQNNHVQPPIQMHVSSDAHAIASAPPTAEPLPVINRGGYILAVPGAEDMQAPFVESVVSSRGRVATGPLVHAVNSSAHTGAQGASDQAATKGFKPALALSLAAGVLALSASVYFIGFSGGDTKRAQVASASNLGGRDVSTQGAAPTSLVDHFQGRAPFEPVEGLKPRQVKVETFRLSNGSTERVDLASTGAVRTISIVSPRGQTANEAGASLIEIPRPRPQLPVAKKSSHLTTGSIGKELQALRDGSRTTPVTIVHIGDSHISSDSFSRGIRDGLQSTYGDAGRGAVIPASAYKYANADGLRMSTSGNWSSANSLKVKTGPYGLSGVRVASSSSSATMTLSTKGTVFDWAEVTVLTGPAQGSVKLFVGGQSKTVNAKASTTGSKVIRLNVAGRDVKVSPAGGGKTTVLNWATGRETAGVRYVNFGISSATAYLQNRWDPKLVANDIRHLNPDLIVWGYGTNEGFNGNLNMTSYRNQVQKIYSNLSAAAPKADWLFVGPASGLARHGKAAGYCNGYRIPAKLGAVRTTLKDFASANGRHFWDWSEAMGGSCGVDRWAKASPRLAAGDRVHLTPKGYRKSAAALVDYIKTLVDKPQVVASVRSPGF